VKRILLAGTHSGVGKTTITAGIIAALRRRGFTVVPFKVGPDYIDPGFHAAAAGMPAGNLDSWMVPADQVLETLQRRVPPAAIAVIEGVMGLYDGRKGEGETGSTAHVAKITGSPVVLVASGAKMARSAAALVGGYVDFDRDLRFAGVILNYVSGESHYRLLAEAIQSHLAVPVLGWLPKDTGVSVPERHLGLLPAAEVENVRLLLERLADLAEEQLNLAALLEAAEAAGALPVPAKTVFPPAAGIPVCRIAVAKDEAFHFYYPENLEILASFGAELVYFSPLKDHSLPADTNGVLLGGGFPEMFAQQLAGNQAMRSGICRAVAGGMPVYAECGGYMYLAQELATFAGGPFPMCGVFPGRAVMRSGRRALGYVETTGTENNYLLPADEICRGHEFHWSDMEGQGGTPVYRLTSGSGLAGERQRNCIGSYIHQHFLSNPNVARRFVAACARFAKEREGMGGVE